MGSWTAYSAYSTSLDQMFIYAYSVRPEPDLPLPNSPPFLPRHLSFCRFILPSFRCQSARMPAVLCCVYKQVSATLNPAPCDGSWRAIEMPYVFTFKQRLWVGLFPLVSRSEKLSSHETLFLFDTTILKLKGQHLPVLSRFPSLFFWVSVCYRPVLILLMLVSRRTWEESVCCDCLDSRANIFQTHHQ